MKFARKPVNTCGADVAYRRKKYGTLSFDFNGQQQQVTTAREVPLG